MQATLYRLVKVGVPLSCGMAILKHKLRVVAIGEINKQTTRRPCKIQHNAQLTIKIDDRTLNI